MNAMVSARGRLLERQLVISVRNSFRQVVQTFVFSSETGQGGIANSKVRSIMDFRLYYRWWLAIAELYVQDLTVHSALDFNAGAWDGAK